VQRAAVFLIVLAATAGLAASPAFATFPGQNGKIAFVRGGDIWTMNADGTGQVNLTNSAVPEAEPAWSPDGSRITFTSFTGPPQSARQLWTMGEDGSNPITIREGFASGPSWSADATQIAFGDSDQFGFGQIHVINADGSGERVAASKGDSWAQNPGTVDWSPDGSLFALDVFEYPCLDGAQIETAGVNGPGGRIVTHSCEANERFNDDVSPSWSPDGQRIAFSRGSTSGALGCPPCGPHGIYTIKPDGTGLQQLTTATSTSTDDYFPSWSPDGTKIAFSRQGSGVMVMNADGTGLTNIAAGDDPSWQPIPVNAYVRPRGATPFRVALVPAYTRCTAPNTSHGAPLAHGSCAPPQLSSAQLTTGTPESNGLPVRMDAFLLLRVVVGNSSTPTDEADVRIDARVNDVMNKDFTDYTGSLRANLPVRITDKDNTPHPGGPGPGTTFPFLYGFNFACTPDPDPRFGSECAISTTADTLVPGTIKESLRTIWQIGRVRVDDAGPDGDPNTPADNAVFAVQGVFVP
jgi:TolB protein